MALNKLLPLRIDSPFIIILMIGTLGACQPNKTETNGWLKPDFKLISKEDFASSEPKRDAILWECLSANGRTMVKATPDYWEKYGVTAPAGDLHSLQRQLRYPDRKRVLPSEVNGIKVTIDENEKDFVEYMDAARVYYRFSANKPLGFDKLSDYAAMCAYPFTETRLMAPRPDVIIIDQQVRALTTEEKPFYPQAGQYKIYPRHTSCLFINGFLWVEVQYDSVLSQEQRLKFLDEFLSKLDYESISREMTQAKK